MEQNYSSSLLDSFRREDQLSLDEDLQDPFEQSRNHEMSSSYFSNILNGSEDDVLKPKNTPNLTQYNDFYCYESDCLDKNLVEPLITGNIQSKENNETPNQINPINKETTITSNKSNSISNSSLEVKTKAKDNTLLGNKRKRNKEKGENNASLGRISKEGKKKGKKGEHSKFKEDNEIRKIKSYYLKFITEKTNSSLSPGHKMFLKINPDVNENLNQEYNDELMKTKIRDIHKLNSINGRYSKKGISKDYNADLVREIYEKNEEKSAMKILDSTYIEYFDVFRKNHINRFKSDVLKKEMKNGEDEKVAKSYVDQLAKLVYGYEEWFKKKVPRSHKKERDCLTTYN